MEFWKIIIGVFISFLVGFIIFLNLDISLGGVSDAQISGLDQKTLYLGVGEPCGVSSVECRPGLICESVIESSISGGICVKPDFEGPSNIRPDIPRYDESQENNWDESDLE